MRDLVRARRTASNDVRQARGLIQMFMLKRGLIYHGKSWTWRHRVWRADRSFEHPGQRIALQSYINGLEQAESRKTELDGKIGMLVKEWKLGPVVEALQALKGIGVVIAATLVAEVGDFPRFSNPRQLMAYLGLVPGEHSSGGSVRTRGITKAGNILARSLLFEAAWSYRLPAEIGQAGWTQQCQTAQWLKDISFELSSG